MSQGQVCLLNAKVSATGLPCLHYKCDLQSVLGPVLAAPEFSMPGKIEVDARISGAEAVLMREDREGISLPVSYISAKFKQHQL